MTECGGDDAKGMVNDNEGVRSLGGRGMSRSIRDGICVCVVVVVVVAVVLLVVVLIVAMEVMGVVVFMVVLGIVVRVACVGVVGVVGDSAQWETPTQTLHTLIVINHSLGIIPTTLCHLSPDVAGASAIGALGDSRTRRTTATQGSHHHLAILKT